MLSPDLSREPRVYTKPVITPTPLLSQMFESSMCSCISFHCVRYLGSPLNGRPKVGLLLSITQSIKGGALWERWANEIKVITHLDPDSIPSAASSAHPQPLAPAGVTAAGACEGGCAPLNCMWSLPPVVTHTHSRQISFQADHTHSEQALVPTRKK